MLDQPGHDAVAEALAAQADEVPEDAQDEEDEDEDDEDGADGAGIARDEHDALLDVIEAMAAHWESETHDSIIAWPWKLFCVKWSRLYDYLLSERKRERTRKRKEQRAKEERETERFFATARHS